MIPASLENALFFDNCAGEVGEGAAAEYTGFRRIYLALPNIESILLDPAIRKDIANAMSKGAGVIRTRESLEEVLATLDQLAKRTSDQPCVEAWEVTNLHCLANVLVRSALIREETRGSHWREDFPKPLDFWQQRILQEMDIAGNYLHNLEKVINE